MIISKIDEALLDEKDKAEIRETIKSTFKIYIFITIILTVLANLIKDSFTHSDIDFVIGLNIFIVFIVSLYYLHELVHSPQANSFRYASRVNHYNYLYIFTIVGGLSILQAIFYIFIVIPTLKNVPAKEIKIHIDSRNNYGSLSLHLEDNQKVIFKNMPRKLLTSLNSKTICDVYFSKEIKFPYIGIETYRVFPFCRNGLSKVDKTIRTR